MSIWSDICEGFEDLMIGIGTFLGVCGPSGFKVATDILQQVAQGGTTPQQVAATAADLAAFTQAVSAAANAAKEQTGDNHASVISPVRQDLP